MTDWKFGDVVKRQAHGDARLGMILVRRNRAEEYLIIGLLSGEEVAGDYVRERGPQVILTQFWELLVTS